MSIMLSILFCIILSHVVPFAFSFEICLSEDIYIKSLEVVPTGTIYSNFKTDYRANRTMYGLNVNFEVISPPGINRTYWGQLVANEKAKDIAFSALQIPLSKEDGKRHPDLVSFPVMVGALVFVYNLPNITDLNITKQIVVNIYLQKIKYWNDTALQIVNPEVQLPSMKILFQIPYSDFTSDTYILTSILSTLSDEWNQQYGAITDTFPSPNISLPFSNVTIYGAATFVTSNRYSFGYASWSTAISKSYRTAKVINGDDVAYDATENDIKQALRQAESKADPTRTLAIPNVTLINSGYPFIHFHQLVVNLSTSSSVSCCAMQETIGFIEYVLDQLAKKKTTIAKYGYVSVSSSTITVIKNAILPLVVCNDTSMKSEYEKYPLLVSVIPSNNWQTGLGLGVGLGTVIFITIIAFFWYYKNVKFANEILWLINPNEISIQFESSSTVMLMGSVISTNSALSTKSNKSSKNRRVKKFNLLPAYWTRNQNLVFLSHTHLNQVSNWRRKTKLLVSTFTKEFSHPNLCSIFGISVIELKPNLVSPICSKGTLHYVLATCPYLLSVDVKYILAEEVLSGLKYLHQKNIIHGSLNSLTCGVDAKWNVKLTDWANYSLMESEHVPALMDDDDDNDLDDDDSLISLLYIDPDAVTLKKPTRASDMYGFGMLLIEIFTRQIPYSEEVEFGDNTYADILTKKLKKIQTPPLLNPVDVPTELKYLIMTLIDSTDKRPTVQATFDQVRKFHSKKAGDSIVDIVMITLEKYVEDLEERVIERTSELTKVTNRMKSLLNEVLPPQIAIKFINEEPVEPEFYECATIFFSDIVGFTVISAKSTPIQVMNFLNELWKLFDDTMVKFDVYKVDTIGDAYMVASGLPIRNGIDHCKHIADLAISIGRRVKNFTIPHLSNENVRVRMGINSGPVTAGIIGHKMPQYCVFGDTVNTASRMESTSLPQKIQVSELSKCLINNYFPAYKFELRGEIEIKGKGSMKTYWLLDLDE